MPMLRNKTSAGTRVAAGTLALALCLLLSACGYSLRGTESAVGSSGIRLQMFAAAPSENLAIELSSALSAGGVELVENDSLGQSAELLRLSLSEERLSRRPVSVNSRARAAQYELTLSATIDLRVGETSLLQATEVSTQSEYFEEIENLTGSQDEIALLTQEMRRSLVQLIIRRMTAAVSTAPPSNPDAR